MRFFHRGPNVAQGHFQLTNRGDMDIDRRMSKGDVDTRVLVAFLSGSQSLASLTQEAQMTPRQAEQAMERLARKGLIVSVRGSEHDYD